MQKHTSILSFSSCQAQNELTKPVPVLHHRVARYNSEWGVDDEGTDRHECDDGWIRMMVVCLFVSMTDPVISESWFRSGYGQPILVKNESRAVAIGRDDPSSQISVRYAINALDIMNVPLMPLFVRGQRAAHLQGPHGQPPERSLF